MRSLRVAISLVLSLAFGAMGFATSDADASLLLSLMKEKQQIRSVVTAVEENCNDQSNTGYQQQFRDVKTQYLEAAKAQNAWFELVHDSIVKHSLLADSAKTTWSTANDAKRKFLDLALPACSREIQPVLPNADGTADPILSKGLVVGFPDMQTLVKHLRGGDSSEAKKDANLLMQNKWDPEAFTASK